MQRNSTTGRLSASMLSKKNQRQWLELEIKHPSPLPWEPSVWGRGTGAQGHKRGGQLRGQNNQEGKGVGAAGLR